MILQGSAARQSRTSNQLDGEVLHCRIWSFIDVFFLHESGISGVGASVVRDLLSPVE